MAVASLRWAGPRVHKTLPNDLFEILADVLRKARQAPRELASLGVIAQSRSFSTDKRLPSQGFRSKMGLRPF
jgi:hypothetical protein